eukprot:jgi/Chlat1/6599/Chrsp46S06103
MRHQEALVLVWTVVIFAAAVFRKGADAQLINPGIDPDELIASPCAAGCEVRGYCNHETRECECPYGFGGPTCNEPLYPACTTPDGYPCECHRQCFAAKRARHDQQLCYEEPDGSPTPAEFIVPKPLDQLAFYERLWPEKVTISAPLVQQRGWLHIDACRNKCSGRGICRAPGVCQCFVGFGGDTCEFSRPIYCLNACESGYCHCDPGSYGMDCSLPLPHQNVTREAVTKAYAYPRVYVYELPAPMLTWHLVEDGWRGETVYQVSGIIYSAWRFILEGLLHSPARTMDPEEADLYYVPVLAHPIASNGEQFLWRLEALQKYLSEKYPYWNRANGADHVWMLPGDLSPCFVQPSLSNVIILHHFGRMVSEDRASRHLGHATKVCHDARKDVVVPNAIDDPFAYDCLYRKPKHLWPERTVTLYFAGGFRDEDPTYSDGVRQELKKLFVNKEGYVIVNRANDYVRGFQTSVFCVAPTGWGWGDRLTLAIVNGCIPVIIQDHTRQAFEGYLPFRKFSIRVAKQDMAKLPEILDAVGTRQIERMQRWLESVWRYFIWQEPGVAFDATLHELARRVRWLRREGLLPGSTFDVVRRKLQ